MLNRLISWLDTTVIIDIGHRVGKIYNRLLMEACYRLIGDHLPAIWEMPRRQDGSVDASTATEFMTALGQLRNDENVELGPLRQLMMFRSCDERRPAIFVMGVFNQDYWVPVQERLTEIQLPGTERTFTTHPETLISKALLGNYDMYITY